MFCLCAVQMQLLNNCVFYLCAAGPPSQDSSETPLSTSHPPPVCKNMQLTQIYRVGQNRIPAPYMTVCMVISLLEIPYVHRIYLEMYGSGQPYKYACYL